MKTTNKLFSEFTPITKQQWIEKVNIDLKGEDFNRKLVWKNLSNIDFQPFYNAEHPFNYLTNTGENARELINYRTIEVLTAEGGNNSALKAISEGVTGLIFNLNESLPVDVLLKGVDLNNTAISFELSSDAIEFAKEFYAFAEQNVLQNKNLKGYFDFGIITNYVTKDSANSKDFDEVACLLKIGKNFPNFKAVTISGTNYLDSGSNQVQEVAYTLNSVVYVIEELLNRDIPVQSIFNNLHVQLAIGSEYFFEIAKFRAFNSLLHEIAKKYGVNNFKSTLTAKTSVWSKSITDPHTNLLRATTEAMSAILGNVDGVLIDAYDKEFNKPSDFSSRIASNIATVLKEESYFGKVSNPVDGSYYIEEVSTKIAEKALELFKAIEAEGGFQKAFESELIQSQIAEIRQEKIKLISQRRMPLVGVNKYPNLMEKVASKLLSDGSKTNSKLLVARRASLEIEAIRKVTEELVEATGKRPIVELTSFGNLTMRKARAAFSHDFIGVSGFEVLQEKSYDTATDAAESSAKSNSNVVIICSSDSDYDENALSFIETFRNINSEKVLLLAGNPVDIMEALTKAGLDGCVNLRSDVIKTIAEVQKKIQKNFKILEA